MLTDEIFNAPKWWMNDEVMGEGNIIAVLFRTKE